ncbi:MAG: RNA polymerase sigma factor [Rhodobacteraceae bacterium]|nr:RNA polymerase sigma factor [Paracoccaceae bacterium]
MLPPRSLERAIERCVREEWGRILASLVKGLGDFQLAEDCLQDAVLVAIEKWAVEGLPKSPAGWLITVARRKAIDRVRRSANFASKQGQIAYLLDLENEFGEDEDEDVEGFGDKRLEMIFTCCHPALEEKTRVALTLRTLGGLSTEEIASAFLDKVDAMTARLTRAKKKIALAGIPYRVPESDRLAERLGSVLTVIYLIFNEGVERGDLSGEAIRLGRIVHELMPGETEVAGLLALMLIHDARRAARAGEHGEFVPLDTQNRARWNRKKIEEGVALLKEALVQGRVGPFQLQAAIHAVHGQADAWEETNWVEIAALYEVLYRVQPSPVIRINQAVAVSYAGSVARGLAMLDEVAGELERYQPYWAARADFLMRVGEVCQARKCYERAISLSTNAQEQGFLRGKLKLLAM